jgi:hypothetical protein
MTLYSNRVVRTLHFHVLTVHGSFKDRVHLLRVNADPSVNARIPGKKAELMPKKSEARPKAGHQGARIARR